MTDPWVPSGTEYDAGSSKRRPPAPKPRVRRLWEKVTRKKVARDEAHVLPGVGENRTVSAATADRSVTRLAAQATASLPEPTLASAEQAPIPQTFPTSIGDSLPATGKQQRRRSIHVREGLLGTGDGQLNADTDEDRVGAWEPGMSDAEMQRRMGPKLRYDDDT